MSISRMRTKLDLQADRVLEIEASSAPSADSVRKSNLDVHTVGRFDPQLGVVVTDHGGSIRSNRPASQDILATLWSGHQLRLGREAVLSQKRTGSAAIWAMSLAFFRETVAFPVLAGIAYAENIGRTQMHQKQLKLPLKVEIEPIRTAKGREGIAFKSDASGFGRGSGDSFDHRLKVFDASGRKLLQRRYGVRPEVVASANGDLLVRSTGSSSDVSKLEIYRNEAGRLQRSFSAGQTGLLGISSKSVSSFSLSPTGTHAVFSLRQEGTIERATPKMISRLHPDGHSDTIVDPEPDNRGHIGRVFIHDIASGTTRELAYDRPHQTDGLFWPEFQWSPDGRYLGYESASPSYAFVFDCEGKHVSSHRTRETLGFQGGGATPLRGVSETGAPVFPEDAPYAPVVVKTSIPLGQ